MAWNATTVIGTIDGITRGRIPAVARTRPASIDGVPTTAVSSQPLGAGATVDAPMVHTVGALMVHRAVALTRRRVDALMVRPTVALTRRRVDALMAHPVGGLAGRGDRIASQAATAGAPARGRIVLIGVRMTVMIVVEAMNGAASIVPIGTVDPRLGKTAAGRRRISGAVDGTIGGTTAADLTVAVGKISAARAIRRANARSSGVPMIVAVSVIDRRVALRIGVLMIVAVTAIDHRAALRIDAPMDEARIDGAMTVGSSRAVAMMTVARMTVGRVSAVAMTVGSTTGEMTVGSKTGEMTAAVAIVGVPQIAEIPTTVLTADGATMIAAGETRVRAVPHGRTATGASGSPAQIDRVAIVTRGSVALNAHRAVPDRGAMIAMTVRTVRRRRRCPTGSLPACSIDRCLGT